MLNPLGVVSKEELAAAIIMPAAEEGKAEEVTEKIFDALDTNQDGMNGVRFIGELRLSR